MAYERALRRRVAQPMFTQVVTTIESAGRDYQAIREAIRNIPADPNLAGATREEAAAHFNRVSAAHKARFTKAMRRWFGVRIDLVRDTPIDLVARVNQNVELVKTIPPRLHERLSRELLELQADAAFDQQRLNKMLRKSFKSSGYDLRRLTRDQTSKLVGQLNHARQTEIGIQRYQWQTSEDERVRPTHSAHNQNVYAWDDPPKDTGHPGEDIQCFPPSVGIAPVGLKASVGYRYIGPIIQICLANGVDVTVTPNHPVLTKTGWCRADRLQEGNQLLVHPYAGSFAFGARDPDFGKVHPSAENLHRLLGGLARLNGTHARRVDLHGAPARRDIDVDVVYTEGELRDRLESQFRQVVVDFPFIDSHVDASQPMLTPAGAIDLCFAGSSRSTRFEIGRTHKVFPLSGTELSHANQVGFAARARRQVQFAEAQHDSGSRHFKPSSHFQHRDAFGIQRPDIAVETPPLFDSHGPGSLVFDAEIMQAAFDHFATDAETPGNFGGVDAGFDQSQDIWQMLLPTFLPVRISRLRVRHHDGPVYSQETDSGLIIANGVVTHNCRCVALAVIEPALTAPELPRTLSPSA